MDGDVGWVDDPQIAPMEVHRTLGPGFLEPVYQAAFELELELRGVPYVRDSRL
jgi:GxxExxY protein